MGQYSTIESLNRLKDTIRDLEQEKRCFAEERWPDNIMGLLAASDNLLNDALFKVQAILKGRG